MTAPQTLLQAAVSRLAARLGSSAVDAAANLALLAQDAPEKLRQELELFWDEVHQEADRLERGSADASPQSGRSAEPGQPDGEIPMPRHGRDGQAPDVQDVIDGLRAQVARLSRGLERRS
jgi:hypothetical protein